MGWSFISLSLVGAAGQANFSWRYDAPAPGVFTVQSPGTSFLRTETLQAEGESERPRKANSTEPGREAPFFKPDDAWRMLKPLVKPEGKLCFSTKGPATGQEDSAALLLMSAIYQTTPPTCYFYLIIPWSGPRAWPVILILHPITQILPQHPQLLLDSMRTGNPDSTVRTRHDKKKYRKCVSSTTVVKRKWLWNPWFQPGCCY